MEPRSRPYRTGASATGASARRAPYAVGEDAGALGKRPGPARERGHQRRPNRSARRPGFEPTPDRYVAGAGPLTSPEARRLRGRPSGLAQARRAWPPALAVDGARLVGERLSRARRGVLISFAVPVTLLLALLAWLFTGSYWQTRHIRIEGTSDPTVIALTHAQRLTGCDAFRCDFSAARRAIAASTRVERVSIQVVFPDIVLARITPRQTVALWRTQGQTWAIGDDGVVIDSTAHDPTLATSDAVVVDDPGGVLFAGRTPSPGARLDAAVVAMARQLRLSATGAGLDPSSLRYTADDGFTMQAQGGALVVFGAPADALATLTALGGVSSAAPQSSFQPATPAQAARGAERQAEEVSAILARLAQRGTHAALLDVRWGGHPYYR